MKKSVYFDEFEGPFWPTLDQLKPYFLAPRGQEWFFDSTNDTGGLMLEGADGTGHLSPDKGRIDVDLDMWGDPIHGVLLVYRKWGVDKQVTYYSKGDLGRLREYVETLHGDEMPIGLYIPYRSAWLAVKEFVETNGELPKSIEWIADEDLPSNVF